MFGPAFFSFTGCAIFLLPMSLLSLRDKFHVLAFWSSQTTSGLSFSAKSVVESKRISKKKSEYWKLWFTAWNCGSELQRTNYKYYFLRWFFFPTDFAEKEGLLVLYKKAFILVYLPRRFSSLSTMFTCSIKHVICILIGVAKLVPHTMLKSTDMSI